MPCQIFFMVHIYTISVDNELITKNYLPRKRHSFWQSSLGPIKRLERIKQLSRLSHTLSFCPQRPMHQSAPMKNVHDLGAIKQVIVWQNLLGYWVLHCFLNHPFVCWVPMPSLDAWKSYRTPHCLVDKWKQWFLSQKLPDFDFFWPIQAAFVVGS